MPESQLCSVPHLSQLLSQENVKIIDGSWYLPSDKVDSRKEFELKHIPSAQFFDIDLISDRESELPHMLPSAEVFATAVGEMGISNDDHIVVYDTAGLFSAARVWWTFKVFGHDNVQVLDGGLPAWLAQSGNLESINISVYPRDFTAELNTELVSDKARLIRNISDKQYTVLDARPEPRFLGTAPEPRPGLPSGHMPESVSVSSSCLISNGRLKPRKELINIFNAAKVTQSTRVITSCGSGVTAAIITLALAECGYGLNRLYDGAWAEWGAADDTVILNKSM